MLDLWYFICIILFIWYLVIVTIAYIGFFEIIFNYNSQKQSHLSLSELEPVTILRPIKGIDAELETCLECSFLQDYPSSKLEILFCVDDNDDESIPIIEKLIAKYPEIDARILVTAIDKEGNKLDHYGPNPKVNNLAKGFLNSKYDIIWIMDSNVWGNSNILKNSIKSLNNNLINGAQSPNHGSRKVNLIHHVPLAVSIDRHHSIFDKIGIKLDEMFLFSSHSKFYVALNKLNPAPCVNGKSNIFRKLDLDLAVSRVPFNQNQFFHDIKIKENARYLSGLGPGNSLKFFSQYIGEDNMIAIALWEFLFTRTTLTSDCVIQPLNKLESSKLGVIQFFKRRIRWLRVRKYMVYLATLTEPTTESIFCGLMGTLAISYLVWNQFFIKKLFILHFIIWCATDFYQYNLLMKRINHSNHPAWFKFRLAIGEWFIIWSLREIFAFPIWMIAILGHEIDWRGRPFKIKPDLTAEEL